MFLVFILYSLSYYWQKWKISWPLILILKKLNVWYLRQCKSVYNKQLNLILYSIRIVKNVDVCNHEYCLLEFNGSVNSYCTYPYGHHHSRDIFSEDIWCLEAEKIKMKVVVYQSFKRGHPTRSRGQHYDHGEQSTPTCDSLEIHKQHTPRPEGTDWPHITLPSKKGFKLCNILPCRHHPRP